MGPGLILAGQSAFVNDAIFHSRLDIDAVPAPEIS
jgi:hypothetical protein